MYKVKSHLAVEGLLIDLKPQSLIYIHPFESRIALYHGCQCVCPNLIHEFDQLRNRLNDYHGKIANQKYQFKINESYLVDVIEAIDGCFICTDEKGTVEIISPDAEKYFGYDKSELVGKNISKLVAHPHADLHEQYIKNYTITGQSKIIGEGRKVDAIDRFGHHIDTFVKIKKLYKNG